MAKNLTAARLRPEYILAPEDVIEPKMTRQDWEDFNLGMNLFHTQEFWDAHEAWEQVWKRHLEPSRIFFQGLIQASAGCYQVQRQIYHGAVKHCENARFKLRQFKPVFLNVNVDAFVIGLEHCHHEVVRLGALEMGLFDTRLFPKIEKGSQ